MVCRKLFQEIDGMNEEYLKIWADVCNIESPTQSKAGVDAVGSYFVKMAQREDFEVEIFPQSVSGNVVCITMNPQAKERPISLSGHMDTVFPIGLFPSPCVRFEGDKIYGPGVMDCKGGLVAGFMAMKALKNVGYTARPIRLLLQSDEENGSEFSKGATIRYICDKAKDSVAFLNLEGGKAGELCVMRKGVLRYIFTIIGEEAHASMCATTGANAILDAAYKIIELEKFKDDDGITCNCGLISGGSAANTVSGKCEFQLDIRFSTLEQETFMRNYVEKLAKTVHVKGCTCQLKIKSHRVAMEYKEQNIALLEKLNKTFKENGLSELKAGKRNGGSDAAEVTEAGIPCVDNIGPVGGDLHTVKEYAYIDELAISAKRIASFVYCFDK